MNTILIRGLAVILLALPAVSFGTPQDRTAAGEQQVPGSTVGTTAGVETNPAIPDYARHSAQDSVLAGGPGGTLPPSQVTLPSSGGGGTTPPTSPGGGTPGDWAGKPCSSDGVGSHDATGFVTLTYRADGTWACTGKGGTKSSGIWLTAGGAASDYEIRVTGSHSWTAGDCSGAGGGEPVDTGWVPAAGFSLGANAHAVSSVSCPFAEAMEKWNVNIFIRKKDGSSEQNGAMAIQATASAG